jgi:hypothetical protein
MPVLAARARRLGRDWRIVHREPSVAENDALLPAVQRASDIQPAIPDMDPSQSAALGAGGSANAGRPSCA